MPAPKKDAPVKADPEAEEKPDKPVKPKAESEAKPKAPPEADLNADPIEPTGVLSHADLSLVEQAKIREPNG